jgi:RNA polymerase sigma factor (sigma-70 family)
VNGPAGSGTVSCVGVLGRRGRAALSGDERDAFARVYEQHFDAVYGYLCRRVGRVEGEDLAAQTFTLALRDHGQYDTSRGTVRAWLFGIAANVLRGHQRGEERRLRMLARTGVDPLFDEEEQVEDRLDAKLATRALAEVLAGLSAGDREVLLLSAWAGLSSEEIGHALDIPAGTVRSRLNRSRRKLQDALSGGDHAYLAVNGQEAVDGWS